MKKWLPFGITFCAALAAAAGLYFWKGRELTRLQQTLQPSAVGRGTAGTAPDRRNGLKPGTGPELAKLNAALRPTRNGVRSLFERASRIMDMDAEGVEKLLTELESAGKIRSPLSAITLMAAYARLAELDPASAMERALQPKRGELRDIALFATMNQWIAKDRNGALAWFAASKDEEAKKKYLAMAAFSMGGGDPGLITELSQSINDPDSRKKALLDSLGALAFSDPEAAMKKLNDIEDPDQRAEAGERVFQGYLARYPEKALELAMSRPPGDKIRENARQSLVQWGEQDPGAALKWLTAQNKETQKELFDTPGSGPGWGFGKATPEQIDDAARQLTSQIQKDKLRAAYAGAQAGIDPRAGLNQLSSIKDPALQQATAGAIGGAAAHSGKVSDMTAWLETAQPNDARDTAVAAFAQGMAQKDPAAAAEWAAKITSPEIRNRTLQNLKNNPPPPPSAPAAPAFRTVDSLTRSGRSPRCPNPGRF